MEQNLKIGLAVKPQGIRGEIKVQPLTDNVERFKKLREVYIDGVLYKVINARIGLNEVFISISGVSDRNTAETFRGKFLTVPRADAVELEQGRYFIADLIGMKVVKDSGETIGEIFSVTEGKTDVIWLKNEKDERLAFPFLRKLLINVDLESGLMTVSGEKIEEVICREN